ncbi:MAG: hypothetical protein H7Y43_14830 [Akkermansiaceae bacterium]|nr:hypothetical protein [Verrucomicrobiales bacterium]
MRSVWPVQIALILAGIGSGHALPLAASKDGVEPRPTVYLIVGAPGEEEFGKKFSDSAVLIESAVGKAGASLVKIGTDLANTNDLAVLKERLLAEPKESPAELWIVLLGHGTFDGREPKFNLRGPDLSAAELAAFLKPFQRPTAIINAGSASGPFIKALAAPGRVVITATKSGSEHNYARFGNYFAEAISSLGADLDKDGQTSLLEAFLSASAAVDEFYKSEGRLATEHALIDDNGDGLGTPPDWFRGIRVVKKSKDGALPDGLRAHQFHLIRSEQEQRLSAESRARRDQMELEVEKLRETRTKSVEAEYLGRLEMLLLEIGRVYERAETNWVPRVISPTVDGVIVLLARDATPHGTTIRFEPQDYKNAITYWTRKDDWVSWEFEVNASGKYEVELLQSCGADNDGSEYQVGVGEQVLRGVASGTGSFTNFVTKVVGVIELKNSGRQTLSVKPLTKPGAAVMDLRQVKLKPVNP